MIEIKFLSRKKYPTWEVTDGKMRWFFSQTNVSVFKHPKDEAEKLYNRLKAKESR